MQKLRLQNVWDDTKKEFDRSRFELRETEKTLSGKVVVTSKIKDAFVSKAMPFIAFRSQLDYDSELAIRSGKTFSADIGLSVNKFTDKTSGKEVEYIQIVINEARQEGVSKHNTDKANAYQPDSSDQEDVLPF